jgi:pSer/pThr/pTyr-binding forkhead associated (FHA) protein
LVELIEQPPVPLQTLLRGGAAAVLDLPNGLRIRLGGESEIIGRAQVARSLGLDELGAISRQHFRIRFEDGKPFIEDMGSANGTTVNGLDIRGVGPLELHDGDVIKMAGKASLKLRSN